MKLYAGAGMTWIAEDERGELWEFPAEFGGWQRRKPWPGRPGGLREVGAYNAYSTGWPGTKGAAAGLSLGNPMKEMTEEDLVERVRRLSREWHSPELDVALAAARTGRLWAVDTQGAGEDAILDGDDADDVLAEVAEHAREHDSEGHPEGRAAWAREQKWTAERIVLVG